MSRWAVWFTHAIGMVLAVVCTGVSELSAIQSAVGGALCLTIHYLSNKE